MSFDDNPDLQLLLHAYKVGEFECGRRTARRLLSKELAPDLDALVRSTRTRYTPTLGETGPVEFQRIITPPAHPGWSLFNPSIIAHNGRLVGIVRSSNYWMVDGGYVMPKEDGRRVRTKNVYVEYGADLQLKSAVVLADPDYQRTDANVEGLEDCRLYSVDGELWVSATVRDCAPFDDRCRIGTARVDPQQGCFTDFELLDTPTDQHEKNWMPVIGQKCWLYSCGAAGKTELAVNSGGHWSKIVTGPSPRICSGFRGGSQLVPFENGYLAAVHEVSYAKNLRVYEHALVWFDEHLRIRKISEPFFFRSKWQIEFAAGMAVLKDHVVMTFGHNDKTAWVAILPRSRVTSMLEVLA